MKVTSIIPTFLSRTAMTLFLVLFNSVNARATDFITDVMVVGGSEEEVNDLMDTYKDKGWTVVDKDLNDGCGSKSDYIYLLYKTTDNFSTTNLTFITGFYISNASGTAPETYAHNGHTYHLVPYVGGSHFEELKGDLNSNAKGDNIHLYYTTEKLSANYDAVTSITFNDTQSGAVGVNGGTTGYDLNKGCGSGSDYIYMHPGTATAHRWIISKNSNGTTCSITGSNYGEDRSQVTLVPVIIEGAVVTNINNDVDFKQFSNLETFYFSNSTVVTTMPSLAGCTKFKQVKIADDKCNVLKTNELPPSITTIPDNAFKNTKITTLSMPNVTSIGASALYGCTSLTKVTIPNSVTSIGAETFYGCTSLAKVIIPQSVTSIGSKAFYGCTGMTYVFMPNSLTSIDNDAFYGCTGLTEVNISNIGVWCNISFGNSASNPLSYSHELYLNGHKKTDLALPETVTNIKNLVFYGCSGLAKVTLPYTVTSIGSEAFYGCSGLTSINIPGNMTSIGAKAFYGCSGLTSINIPGKVTSIGTKAFYGCTSLPVENGIRYADTYIVEAVDKTCSSYQINSRARFMGEEAFINCTALTSITFPGNLVSIGASAFKGCTALASIDIPGNVTGIGNAAFSDCSKLTTVSINSNAILSRYYTSSSSMKTLFGNQVQTYNIGDGVKSIGNWAFYQCTSLISVTIGNNVTSIGKGVFCACPKLSSLDIGKSLTEIGQDAFLGTALNTVSINSNAILSKNYTSSSSLKEIFGYQVQTCTIGDDVTSIGDYAFNGFYNMQSVIIGKGLKSIGSYAFNSCNSLQSITIPNSVTSISDDAFHGCTGVKDVYCHADPSVLTWNEYNCNDFKENRGTICHVFNAEEWNAFVDVVNVTFVDDLLIVFADNADNSTVIQTWDNRIVNAKLEGRVLYNYGWNTLCLPFSLESLDGSPLEGVTVMELDVTGTYDGKKTGYDASTNTLHLYFKNASSITAGKPYLFRWQSESYTHISNPIFRGGRASSAAPTKIVSSDSIVTFIGNYDPVSFAEDEEKNIIFMGAYNTLYNPKGNMVINAFRGRFLLPSGLIKSKSDIGDVNHDGEVTVSDVALMVNRILGEEIGNFDASVADINNDNEITVSDVMAVVSIILGNMDFKVVTNMEDASISFRGNGFGPARAGENLIWDEYE